MCEKEGESVCERERVREGHLERNGQRRCDCGRGGEVVYLLNI